MSVSVGSLDGTMLALALWTSASLLAWAAPAQRLAIGPCIRASTSASLPLSLHLLSSAAEDDQRIPSLMLHSEQLAILRKPAGVPLAESGVLKGRRRRNGKALLTWALSEGGIAPSEAADALDPLVALTPLSDAIGGVIVLAKTKRAEELLRTPTSMWCGYAAVVGGSPSTLDAKTLELVQHQTAGTIMHLQFVDVCEAASLHSSHLSLVRFSARPNVSTMEICDCLDCLGLCVVGSLQARQRFERRGDAAPVVGGPHIALVRVDLDAAVSILLPPGSPSRFEVAVPKKFVKTMRRERLQVERRNAAVLELADATALGSESQSRPTALSVPFMGMSFLVGRGELSPRQSSEVLVREAVAIALATAAIEQERQTMATSARGAQSAGTPLDFPAARILDLGCGCGALLLSALRQLGPSAMGVGVDIDASALTWAHKNVKALGFEHQVTLIHGNFGDLHQPSERRRLPSSGFDAIMCNPPYLPEKARQFRITSEYDRALYAGVDGLDAYATLARSLSLASPPLLGVHGVLVLQLPGACSERKISRISHLFSDRDLDVRHVVRDSRGIARCILVSQAARR